MGWIIAGVVVLLIVVVVGLYNGLVGSRNRVDNAWSQVDVQLKRRYDLIPNLVETVKGYASHAQQTFERVIKARNAAQAAQGPAEQAEAENFLTGALRQLFALAEAYPELVCNLHRGLCEGVVDSVGGGSVEEFATLYDPEPCHVVVGVGYPDQDR